MADFKAGQLLRILVNERDTWHGAPLYGAIVEMLKREHVAGASVFRGVEGFGTHGEIHMAKIWSLARAGLNPYVRLFLATGILGGYTTFSTFAYETYALGTSNLLLQSFGYAAGSVLAGIAAAYLGITLVRALHP